MKKLNFILSNKKAFTLIEIIVSVTILSIIMVSVMFIFINSTDISAKSEINRVMQENIKNVIETISEDVRKNWIIWVSSNNTDNCNFNFVWTNNYKLWNKLCTNTNNYFIAKEILSSIVRVDDMNNCSELSDDCFLVWKDWERLTNSSVSIKNLKFYLSNDLVPKITILITFQPSVKKWVKPNLIKENKMFIQTTISDRIILKQ